MSHKSRLPMGVWTLWMVAFAGSAMAQNSAVVGTLTDQAGAVVPNGSVTVAETSTGATHSAKSNELGLFRILNLLPGTYSLRAELAGFKTFQVANIVLDSGEIRDLGDLKLEVGGVTEEISVTAQPTPVQTASSERSALIDGNQLNNVALKGRDIFGYLGLVSGVVDTTTDRSLAGPASNAGVFINGMADSSKNVSFDGVTELDQGGTDAIYVNPSMDAVGEVRILTSAFQAENGRYSGGTINMVTKAGTQNFHGTAYWQHRNEGLNANTFFNNRQNIHRPLYRYFIGGGTIGGPVYIPHHFNTDKRRLFFFWSEEYTSVALPTTTSTANMPTVAERSGDFSHTVNSAGQLIAIIDPTTHAAFPGNMIPANRTDATGQAYLNLFLKPNGYVNPAPGQQYTANFLASATPAFERRDDIVRIDYNVTQSMLIYARFGKDVNDRSMEFTVGPGIGPLDNFQPGWQWVGHVVNTFSPTMVNDFTVGAGFNNFGYLRNQGDQDSNYYRTASFNPPTLRPFPTGTGYEPYLPSATFSGGAASNPAFFQANPLSVFPPFPIPYQNYNDTYSYQDDLTKVYGNHGFKFGVYFERNIKSEPGFGGSYNGAFNFGSSTSNPLDSGYGYANALLGIFQTYTENSARVFPTQTFNQLEGYAQDNYRLSRRFTLDVGVRFAKIGLPKDTGVLSFSNFYPQLWQASQAARLYRPAVVGGQMVAQDPLTGATTYAALANTLVPGTGSAVNGMMVNGLTGHGDYANLPSVVFVPRIGFAWDVKGNGKTAIRASFGQFSRRPDGNWLPGRASPPTTFSPIVYYTSINQIPQAAAAAAISPTGATEVEGDQKVATSDQVNVTIQRNIGFGTVVDVGYVGNFDRHALGSRSINPIPLGAYANPANLFNGTELNQNLLRTAYPGMGAISYQCNCLSDLNYHALQANAQRRLSQGLQFGVSYVFSKALGTQGSDPYHTDRSWYYGPLAQDRTQVFHFNWIYQIPGVSNHIAKYVLNNWTLSGIASAQTGGPVTPSCSAVTGPVTATDPSLTGGGARCAVVGDPKSFAPSFFTNFNTAAFALASAGTFGNAGLGILRQPSWWNVDVTIEKRIPLGREQKRAFRARIEAYNVFNHTEFNSMGASLQLAGATNLSTTYGQYTATNPARVLSTTLRFEF